jgi:hypothetical protein
MQQYRVIRKYQQEAATDTGVAISMCVDCQPVAAATPMMRMVDTDASTIRLGGESPSVFAGFAVGDVVTVTLTKVEG